MDEMNAISPFDGCYSLIIYNQTTVKEIHDIVNLHNESKSPQTTEVMQVYFSMCDDFLCNTDLPVSDEIKFALKDILDDL